jgi:hypothetical protein
VDQEQTIAKAHQFADTALSVEIEKLSRQSLEKLAESRARLAQRGIVQSGIAVVETAKIHSERVTTLLQSRLNLLLEGFELYHVAIDDDLRDRLIAELAALRSTWITNTDQAMKQDHVLRTAPVSPAHYLQLLGQNVGMQHNEVRTQIDRRRFMQKKAEGNTSITVYHVQGNNNRWLTNSQDHSVNVITQSSDQIFANLRQEIESKVPAGDEQKDILGRLSALEQAHNSPSIVQRYTEFIAAAANHMQLIAPFIPALTEMLQKAF